MNYYLGIFAKQLINNILRFSVFNFMKVNQTYLLQLIKTIYTKLIILCLCICVTQIGFAYEPIHEVGKSNSVIDNYADFQTNSINVFEVLAEPQAITIEKGSSGTIDITINRATDFTGQVNLSIFPSPGLPANVNAPFTPSSVPAGTSNSVLTLEVGEQAVSGTYNVVIAGTGSQDGTTKLRTVSISLTEHFFNQSYGFWLDKYDYFIVEL